MANKKTSQLSNKTAPDNSDFIRLGNVNSDWYITWSQIVSALNLALSDIVTINVVTDTTYNLILGNTPAFAGFTIDYIAIRGTRIRKEILQILCDGTNVLIQETGYRTLPDTEDEDCGLAFAVDISGDNIRLIITSDDSDASTTKIMYKQTSFPA
jgi:hypothetical protein